VVTPFLPPARPLRLPRCSDRNWLQSPRCPLIGNQRATRAKKMGAEAPRSRKNQPLDFVIGQPYLGDSCRPWRLRVILVNPNDRGRTAKPHRIVAIAPVLFHSIGHECVHLFHDNHPITKKREGRNNRQSVDHSSPRV